MACCCGPCSPGGAPPAPSNPRHSPATRASRDRHGHRRRRHHRFDRNLDKLDQIYRGRFQHVRYLMPFYDGDRPDVYPVYYSSYHFQGFVLEAWRRLRGEGFTHLAFVADDILLNPRINEGNLCAELLLEKRPGSAFITTPGPITAVTCNWVVLPRALTAVVGQTGVDWEAQLPSYAEAEATLRAHGFAPGRFGWRTVLQRMTLRSFFLTVYYLLLFARYRKTHPGTTLTAPPYPLITSYSDLFVVPTGGMDRFCHYCAVFASMGVHVEVGLPTALALSAPLVGCAETAWYPHDDIQHPSRWEAFGRQYDFHLPAAAAAMGERELFVHPVKLSRWKL